MEPTSRIVAIPDQVSCDVAGDTAILNLNDGVYYGLNPVGTRIWSLLQKPVTVEEILAALVAEYEVDAAACELDLVRVLGDLHSHGLIQAA